METKLSWFKRIRGIVFEKRMECEYYNVFRKYKDGTWKFGIYIGGFGGGSTTWETLGEAFNHSFFLKEIAKINLPIELSDEIIMKYKNYHK